MIFDILWSFLVLSVWLKKKYWVLPLGVNVNIFFQSYTQKEIVKVIFSNCWIIFRINEYESCMAVQKCWKISLVVMVSLEKYWIYHSWPSTIRDKFNIFLVITITTHDIFQYFLTALHNYFRPHLGAVEVREV